MTTIEEFEARINDAETAIGELRAHIDTLRVGLDFLKNQQPEPESLFGRWATHPEYGRGIIISSSPDNNGEVRFAYRNGSYTDGVDKRFVRREHLDLDPLTLTTEQDFKNAPVGTVVEEIGNEMETYMKFDGAWGVAGLAKGILHRHMPPCRVIRWGDGK